MSSKSPYEKELENLLREPVEHDKLEISKPWQAKEVLKLNTISKVNRNYQKLSSEQT